MLGTAPTWRWHWTEPHSYRMLWNLQPCFTPQNDLLNCTEIQFLFCICRAEAAAGISHQHLPQSTHKAPAPPWDCPCGTGDTKHSPRAPALQTNIPHSSSTRDVLTFTPRVLQDKRNGKRRTVPEYCSFCLFSFHHITTLLLGHRPETAVPVLY